MITLPIKSKKKVEEMLIALRSQSPRDALLFQTGVNTILRISDILRLQVRHVATDGEIHKYIDIREQKTRKNNRILITSTLAPVLKAYIERYGLEDDDYIFFRTKGIIESDNTIPITRDWASKVLCAAAKACNIKNFNTQSMRKTHAYHVYMATGKNIALVQSMLNHSNPSTTLRYIGITQQEMDEAKELICF